MESVVIPYLFAGDRLGDVLFAAARQAEKRLAGWPADDLLSREEADVADQLISLATIEVPSLARGKAWLGPPREAHPYVGDATVRFGTVTRFTLVVPVTGDPSLFGMRSGILSAGFSGIRGEIDHPGKALRLHCDNPGNPAQAKAYFDRLLDKIEQRLERTRADIEGHNQKMARQLPAAVARRRAKLLEDRDLGTSIGYPTKKRPDATSYSVPLTRRQITLGRPARPPEQRPNAYIPEPAIDDADYEAVLEVMRSARNSLERIANATTQLKEEHIRDLLLPILNSHFKGKAAGEVFQGAGRTDILIREDDRNVFIGECKISDRDSTNQSVETVVTKALDQLLGYLVWRDTKAALVLFIRDSDESATIHKALRTISNHPNCLRLGKINTDGRHDFVLHADGDEDREIHLAFLPFRMRSKTTPRTVATRTPQSKR
jgi:hypothetical protein